MGVHLSAVGQSRTTPQGRVPVAVGIRYTTPVDCLGLSQLQGTL